MILKDELKDATYKIVYKDNSEKDEPKIAFCKIYNVDDNYLYIMYPDGNKKIINHKIVLSIVEAKQQ